LRQWLDLLFPKPPEPERLQPEFAFQGSGFSAVERELRSNYFILKIAGTGVKSNDFCALGVSNETENCQYSV